MPRAFKSAGLLVGLIGNILIGILCTHTVYILVSVFRCLDCMLVLENWLFMYRCKRPKKCALKEKFQA